MKETVTVARYGAMREIGIFPGTCEGLKPRDSCIVKTGRGTELGRALKITETDDPERSGELLRKATAEDLAVAGEITDVTEPEECRFCSAEIEKLELPMKLVSVEHLFGGEKIIFYFAAEGRVDFRELVKSLAQEYKTRIEMKQIGVRDEAKLLADFELCGREICCKAYMKEFEPVTMKMAKAQKTTLDPTKISGRCGRLKCCLNFESQVYEEMAADLPKKGAIVVTTKGRGEVIDLDILQQIVTLETENRQRIRVAADEILSTEEEESDD